MNNIKPILIFGISAILAITVGGYIFREVRINKQSTLNKPDSTFSTSGFTNWSVLSEKDDESRYKIQIGKYIAGLELKLYSVANGDINKDKISIVAIGQPEGNTDEPIMAQTAVGYENDNRQSVNGGHLLYYVFPSQKYVKYLKITLISPKGQPRLNLNRSSVYEWNPIQDNVFDAPESSRSGWYQFFSQADLNNKGKGGFALFSCGAGSLGGCPSESAIDYYVGKRFAPPKREGRPEVYIEVGYTGGINVAPESFLGDANYMAKIDVGLGQGSWITNAVQKDKIQTLWQVVKYGEKDNPVKENPVIEEGASGVIDILSEIGDEILKSPKGRLLLKGLDYVLFVYDVYSIITSLDYNEKVAKAERIVFSSVPINIQSDYRMYAWLHAQGHIKAAGLSGIMLNFMGKSPWGDTVGDTFGVNVWNLPEGGLEIGGVLLHYDIPFVVKVEPLGDNMPVNSTITVQFTKPIDDKSLWKKDSIIIDYTPKRLGSYHPFDYRLSPDGKTLYLIPNYKLYYNTLHTINLTSSIKDTEGNGLEPFSFSFTTEKNPRPPQQIYSTVSIISSYGIPPLDTLQPGDIYEINPTDISWSSYANAKGGAVEGLMRTNDPDLECYNDEPGFIVSINGKFYFGPHPFKKCPYLVVFELGKKKESKRFTVGGTFEITNYLSGNTYIAEQVGIQKGAKFNLEPIAYQEYSAMGTDIAVGILRSSDLKCLDGKELHVYGLIRDQFAVIPDKPDALFSIRLQPFPEFKPAPVDFVVYSSDESCKGAWRFLKR